SPANFPVLTVKSSPSSLYLTGLSFASTSRISSSTEFSLTSFSDSSLILTFPSKRRFRKSTSRNRSYDSICKSVSAIRSRVKELLPILLAESLAIAVVAEAGIGTSWRMNTLSMSAVCAVFLTSNLAENVLTGWADFVHHPVFELVSACSLSDDSDFILWQSDRLATSCTDVIAHSTSCSSLGTKFSSTNLSGSEPKLLAYLMQRTWRVL